MIDEYKSMNWILNGYFELERFGYLLLGHHNIPQLARFPFFK